MSDEAIMENYGNIKDVYSKLKTVGGILKMLDARILKLEAIIVELANVEPEEPYIDWAEQAQMVRDKKEKKE